MQLIVEETQAAFVQLGLGPSGAVRFSLKYTFDDETVDNTTANRLLGCVTQHILSDSASDHADVVARYVRDEEIEVSATSSLIPFQRSITEKVGDNSFTLSLSGDLPIIIPADIHNESLQPIEEHLTPHVRAHLLYPNLSDLEQDIQQKGSMPATHLICRLSGQSPRRLIASAYGSCQLAQELVDKLVPDTPMSFPEIEKYAALDPDGVRIFLGTATAISESHGPERIGQYL